MDHHIEPLRNRCIVKRERLFPCKMTHCCRLAYSTFFFFLLSIGIASAQRALEPFTIRFDFEDRMLHAWSSYPLWQDTAYDDNFTVGAIIPGAQNLSITQLVNPYEPGDVWAGAQKKLDFFLSPEFSITAEYYIKTHLPVESITVRIAAGPLGKLDYTVRNPKTNCWEPLTLSYGDVIASNPRVAGENPIHAHGLAFLVKTPDADPVIPIYLGLDNITLHALRETAFQFVQPEMTKLTEWKPYIARKQYRRGELFTLRGVWPVKADRAALSIASFTDSGKVFLKTPLKQKDGQWALDPFRIGFEKGMYRGVLTAFREDTPVAETEFTFTVAPEGIGGKHPRLWFDAAGRQHIRRKLKEERSAGVAKEIASESARFRTDFPLERMKYDFDQFPDENWLVTRYSWSRNRITLVGESVYWNALAWSLLDDRAAGEYAKNVLAAYAGFPTWNHPWMVKNGRPFYLLMGDMAMYFALGYDLVYDLLSAEEGALIRKAFMKEVIRAVHKGYVEDNMVTTHTSNWIAAIVGGSLLCQTAIHGDGPEVETEPFLSGAVFKDYALIQHATGRDGGYGEGYNYYHYSSRSWSKSLPALENVFGIDLSARLNGVYDELVWSGRPTEKETFYFGDSRGALLPMESWAWLLPKYKDPLLAWMYRLSNTDESGMKSSKNVSGFQTFSGSGVSLFSIMQGVTLMDLIHDTESVSPKAPSDSTPVRLFRDIGSTVFRSGWGKDDFVFVMRTGPFYNHQHLDQGTFWLADRGCVFIGERQGSTYYDDPLYESHYTKPIAHSTILVDHRTQSQRTGDPRAFIDGFDDHAFVTHFLDGKHAAFSSGDIGRLYMGAVKSIQRNALYLKPRAILMLDTIVPAERNADITLLYQTGRLRDIAPGKKRSAIAREGNTLHIHHLAPEQVRVEAVETPHYLATLKSDAPLEREGMLTLTTRTDGAPLVIANLLTTAGENGAAIETVREKGCVRGRVSGTEFAFTTMPGSVYTVNNISTDALAVSRDSTTVFAAMCRTLSRNGSLILESDEPITCEVSENIVKYYRSTSGKTGFGVAVKPSRILVNGIAVKDWRWDGIRKVVTITIPEGEGTVTIYQ